MMNPAEFANIARAEETLWWYDGMGEIALRLLRDALQAAPNRILDAGGGTGGFASRLAREFSCPVHMIDASSEGMRFAQARGLKDLILANAGSLPIAPESYDCVLSMDVLVYFAPGDEHNAIAELTRVLRPGGILMIRVAALDALRSRHSLFTRERQRFTRGRLKSSVSRSGLELVRCTYLNSLLLPAAFAKFRIWEPLLRKAPASGVDPVAQWLNTALRGVLRLEERWIASGGDFALGQSLLLLARKPT